MNKLRILCIGILALLLFAPAAGAIYIPGQSIPDDGQYHILAADDNTASSGWAPSSMGIGGSLQTMPMIGQADIAIPVQGVTYVNKPINGAENSIPGISTAMPPIISDTNKSSTFPAGAPAIMVPPTPLGMTNAGTVNSITTIPAGSGNIYSGSAIGHIMPPVTPGYWDNVDPASLHTNMPMLNSPIIFA